MQYMCCLVSCQVQVERKRCIAARHSALHLKQEAVSKTEISADTIMVVDNADVDESRDLFVEAAWKILWARESQLEEKRRICHTRRLDRYPA